MKFVWIFAVVAAVLTTLYFVDAPDSLGDAITRNLVTLMENNTYPGEAR